MRFGAVYCLYDDHEYLEVSLFPVSKYLEQVYFLINDTAWNGSKTDNSATINKVKELCLHNKNFKLIESKWKDEVELRNYGLSLLYKQGIDYSFIIDSDEIYKEQEFLNIIKFVEANTQFAVFHIEWNTYWKKYYRISPREDFKPVICVKVNSFLFNHIRSGTTNILRSGNIVLKTADSNYNYVLIPPHIAVCYHMSYARDNEFIIRKVEISSHATEFVKNWYEDIWLRWHPGIRNLHPVTPNQYQIAVKEDFTDFPEQFKTFIKKERNPECYIVILNWNSKELLENCLKLIEKNTQNYKIVVVDNGSKDDSVEFIKNLDVIKVFNEKNLGFAGGVNSALKIIPFNRNVCLLNVDAEPQEGWLDEIYKTYYANPNCGLVGPLGNEVQSGWQKQGFVNKDTVVPVLMGFCLFIAREVIDKIGILDERFEIGQYEDNDYCFRAMVARFTCMISSKSLVIHHPHQVFKKNGVEHLLSDTTNREKYYDKIYQTLLNLGKFYNFYENPEIAKLLGLKL